jgi:hypothetical protein
VPNSLFGVNDKFIENRSAVTGKRNLAELARFLDSNTSLSAFSDFHLLLFIKESGVMDQVFLN